MGAAAVGVSMPAVAQGSDFEQLIAAAQQAREAGELERCLELLDKASALQPSPALTNNRAKILEELGRYDAAANLYKQVADDPTADANLRSLDASRFAALQGKLARGWLRPRIAPSDTLMWLNGTPTAGAASGELPANAGMNVLEMSRPGSSVIVWRQLELPAGKRTEWREDLEQPGATDGALVLDPKLGAPLSWRIEGYELRSQIGGRTAVRVAPGVYDVSIELIQGDVWEETVRVPPSTQVGIGADFAAQPDIPNEPVVAPPKGRSPWPYVVGGVGLAMAGVGTWLLVDGAQDANEIDNASHEPRVLPTGTRSVVTGITMSRAADLEASANLKTGLGASFVGVGVAAVVGGIVWWLIDDPSEASGTGEVQTSQRRRAFDFGVQPNGVVVGGTF